MTDQPYHIKAVTIDNLLYLSIYSDDLTVGVIISSLSGSFFIIQGADMKSFPMPDDVLVKIKDYFLGE